MSEPKIAKYVPKSSWTRCEHSQEEYTPLPDELFSKLLEKIHKNYAQSFIKNISGFMYQMHHGVIEIPFSENVLILRPRPDFGLDDLIDEVGILPEEVREF